MPESEKLFFAALQQIVKPRHLKAKSLDRRVSTEDVFLDSDYTLFDLPADVVAAFGPLLEGLLNTGPIPSGSLSRYVDGLLVGHPELGTRIVEFDEEQHFNTFRLVTLQCLAPMVSTSYAEHYLKLCGKVDVFNAMLKKHRLRVKVTSVPGDAASFQALVEAHATTKNGYIAPKAGFEYWGVTSRQVV